MVAARGGNRCGAGEPVGVRIFLAVGRGVRPRAFLPMGDGASPAARSAEAARGPTGEGPRLPLPGRGEGARLGMRAPFCMGGSFLVLLSGDAAHGFMAALPCWYPLAERGRGRRSGIGRTASGRRSLPGGSLATRHWPANEPGTFGPVAAVSQFAVQSTADWCSNRRSKPRSSSSVW